MREFHENLVSKINKLDVYRKIDLYNSQDIANENKEEEHIFYPACFIEYEVTDINRLAYGVKDVYLTVRLRLFLENYTFSRLDDLDAMEQLSAHLTNFRGGQNDNIQFTSFEEIGRDYDENHDMVNIPVIEFLTVYRDTSAYKEKEIVFPNKIINAEIDG